MTSSDSMIERVTKTLSGELLRRGFMTQIEDGVRLKPDIEAMARAAIEAMMEPPNVVGCLGVRVSAHDEQVVEIHLDHEAEGIDVVRLVRILERHDRTSLTGDTK